MTLIGEIFLGFITVFFSHWLPRSFLKIKKIHKEKKNAPNIKSYISVFITVVATKLISVNNNR